MIRRNRERGTENYETCRDVRDVPYSVAIRRKVDIARTAIRALHQFWAVSRSKQIARLLRLALRGARGSLPLAAPSILIAAALRFQWLSNTAPLFRLPKP